jgi:Ca2+-binding RTX toxin-like protein
MAFITGSGLLVSTNDFYDRIIGTSANDTVSYSAATAAVNVSLSLTGAQSTGGSYFDDLVSIENIIGSSFGDTLQGTNGNNVIDGGAGLDTASYSNAASAITLSLSITTAQATGGGGVDTLLNIENIIGSSFSDNLKGSAAANIIIAGSGNDLLVGTSGSDVLDGGDGFDTADYNSLGTVVNLGAFGVLRKGSLGTDSLIGVETIIGSSLLGDTVDHSAAGSPATGTVTNLSTGVVTVNGSASPLPLTFNVSQFENVIGSNFADTIFGNAANNAFSAGAGNDTLNGGAGNDTLNGGAGTDTASYSDASAAVTVSLSSGSSSGGAGIDTLIAIENVIGSSFADAITGNNDANSLSGEAGNDTLIASAGNDTLNGGSGSDIANYSSLGTLVSLGAFGVLSKGALSTDSLIGIETIIGSSLLGDTVDHSAAGSPATGTVTNLSTGVVTVNGTASPLPLTFNVSQFENVIGSNFADTIFGNAANNAFSAGAGNDTLNGGAGNDTLNGGAGTDTASYSDASAAVTVTLSSGSSSGGAGIDTLITIEDIIGSSFADTILGGADANSLSGEAGNDSISAGSGNDTITGGAGKDQLSGEAGIDKFVYLSLADSLLASYDLITDYATGGVIDRPGTGVTLNSSSGTAANLAATSVGSILNVFSFTPNSSAAFTVIGFSGTFIAFNDGTAGFDANADSILQLPGYNINVSNTVIIA